MRKANRILSIDRLKRGTFAMGLGDSAENYESQCVVDFRFTETYQVSCVVLMS